MSAWSEHVPLLNIHLLDYCPQGWSPRLFKVSGVYLMCEHVCSLASQTRALREGLVSTLSHKPHPQLHSTGCIASPARRERVWCIYMPSLVPSPFSRGERKGPGIHCLRMCQISLEFQGTVFFSNHSYSKRHLEVELHFFSLWVWLRQRVMAASTECSAFPAAITFSLGKLGLSRNNIEEEETALSNLG